MATSGSSGTPFAIPTKVRTPAARREKTARLRKAILRSGPLLRDIALPIVNWVTRITNPPSQQRDETVECSTDIPISAPLKTPEEVKQWQPGADPYNVGWVQLQQRKKSPPHKGCVQRLLVCHDMMGGYTDQDRFVQGGRCDSAFRLYHWNNIDLFVYFSHSLLTIPPVNFINAAHANGVPILGTLITEWEAGATICDAILGTAGGYEALAQKMVGMAEYYGFDGWLINIENPIRPSHVPIMLEFVRLLTVMMHSRLPESQVIWYDSVTHKGELKWQNELNALNQTFFDACDGIFLNYCWNEDKLAYSRTKAGKRAADVYVGVDVFGRGCPGGGGWNTREAVQAIADAGLSAAIFAPGWVYEELQDKEDFHMNQMRFWDSIASMCPEFLPAALPLETAFNPGVGERFYVDGKLAFIGRWAHLSEQTLCIPSRERNDLQSTTADGSETACARGWDLCFDTSYNGGACLQLYNRKSASDEGITLLKTEAPFADQLCVTWTWKSSAPDALSLTLAIDVRLGDDGPIERLVLRHGQEQHGLEVSMETADVGFGWVRNCARISSLGRDGILCGVSAVLDTVGACDDGDSVLLGQLMICEGDDEPKYSVTDATCDGLTVQNLGDERRVSFSVSWSIRAKNPEGLRDRLANGGNGTPATGPQYFDVFCTERGHDHERGHDERRWLGRAYATRFYASNLPVAPSITSLEIEVVPRPRSASMDGSGNAVAIITL